MSLPLTPGRPRRLRGSVWLHSKEYLSDTQPDDITVALSHHGGSFEASDLFPVLNPLCISNEENHCAVDWTHSFAESISNETSLETGRIALSDTASIDDTVCCPDSGALLCSECHSIGITHCDAHSASGGAANIVSIDYAQCSSVECTDSSSLGGSDQRCR